MVDNRYTILEPLGSGGAGEVFLARDEVLGRRVALKVLSRRYADDEEFVERFRREAQSAAALNHPNIVAVHDLLEGDEALCIVMEYVQGITLAGLIEREGALPWRAAAAIVLHTARGLEAAHRHGIVHRDVKPANILLANLPEEVSSGTDASGDALADAVAGGRAVVKVTDFGVALVGSARPITEKGVIMGTVQYISPEMVMGEAADPRSDLYSLGVVLYEMLTGRRPFEAAEAESPLAVAMRHVNEVPHPPSEANSEIPPAMDAATLGLLAKDPGERHKDAATLAEELEGILRESPAGRTPPSGPNGDRKGPTGGNPKTRRFPDAPGVVFTRPRRVRGRSRRRRALLRAALAALIVAALVPAGFAGADRLSDGGLSRALGLQVPLGAPQVRGEPPVEEASAEAAVEKFVMGVWGYAGTDEEEYWSRVNPLVTDGFRGSPVWDDVVTGAELAGSGGPAVKESFVAREFHRFEVLQETPASVVGVAYFVNEKYPEGRRYDYSQEFALVKEGGGWRLDRGEDIEPVDGAGAGAGVTSAVEEYYAAVDREDWSYTYDHLDSRARDLFTEEEWRRRNRYFADNEGLELASITVEATLSTGILASVKVDRTFNGGYFLSRNTFFVYEGGAWKHRLSEDEVNAFMPGVTFEEFVRYQGTNAPLSG